MEGTAEQYRAAAHDWQKLCAEKDKQIENLKKQIENLRLLRGTESAKSPTVVERGFIIISERGAIQGSLSTREPQKQIDSRTPVFRIY